MFDNYPPYCAIGEMMLRKVPIEWVPELPADKQVDWSKVEFSMLPPDEVYEYAPPKPSIREVPSPGESHSWHAAHPPKNIPREHLCDCVHDGRQCAVPVLKWTSEPPKEPGWYWCNYDGRIDVKDINQGTVEYFAKWGSQAKWSDRPIPTPE